MNTKLCAGAVDAMADWRPNFGYLTAAYKDWDPGRPVRLAVLGDFGASAAVGHVSAGQALAQATRPFAVEFDSVDAMLARLAPRLSLPLGPGGSTLDIGFSALDDFHPDALFDRLEIFRALASLRQRLLSPTTFSAAAAELLQSPARLPDHADAAPSTTGLAQSARALGGSTLPSDAHLSDFARLLGGGGSARRRPGQPD